MAALLELGVSWTQGGSAPLFPGPRFCDTLRLGLWSSQCMTELGPGEIAFLGGMTIVYKSSIDLLLYVVGSSSENELMLMSVLACLFDSLSHILRKNVEKRWLLENMDGAFLVLDEIVDGGSEFTP
ncbi:coatomer subunit zeta-2-like protein [Cricetulus griseus]|uniref:Coatomer subunit zeta n=1 Tax=Cricetulus griseus TaxID=10029 RepID=A0A061HX88_CRIGR|nr:coatomer subunit zeta-2-like protein [Cricetulus griseus]